MRALVADGVHQPRGLEHQQPGGLDPDPGFGDPVLDDPLLGQRAAERGAAGDAPAHELQRPLGRADQPHAVVDPAGAEPGLRDREPVPLAADQVGGRDGDVGELDLGVTAVRRVVNPNRLIPRRTVTPGVSRGTRIIDCCRCRSAPGSVLPITMRILQAGSIAPDDHHFRPLITYLSPSRSILVAMLVASDEATSGSVMQNAERISPSSSGRSHCSRCSLGAELGQQFHVAGVGGGAVQRLGRERRAVPGDLGQRGVLEVGQPGALRVAGQEEVPQPAAGAPRP